MDNNEIVIWKRLHRIGSVCSKDLELLLNITNVHASRLLKSFADNNSDKVYKEGRFIYLYPNSDVPESIKNESLLQSLRFSNKPQITGILDNEIPIIINDKVDNNDYFSIIFEAIKGSNKLEIVYVTFDLKETPTSKTKPILIVPSAFTMIEGIMYLVAVNLSNNNKVELFNLTRITYIKTLNKSNILKTIDIYKKVNLVLTFNELLTDEQKNILAFQFDLEKYNDTQYVKNLFDYEKDLFIKKYIQDLSFSYFVKYEIIEIQKEEVIVNQSKNEDKESFENTIKELLKTNPKLTQVDIANHFGVSKQAIFVKLKKFNIDLKNLKKE